MSTHSPASQQACLHLLFSRDTDTLQACAAHCRPGDSVILLNTAVSLLLDEAWCKEFVVGVSIHALQADALAQGMSEIVAKRDCELISDAAWANLVKRYPHCLSWK